MLPPDVNAWRSFNVRIRQGAGLKPYSMTYVCNRHQNDAAGGDWNHANSAQMFVTLNPTELIPDRYVLPRAVKSSSNGVQAAPEQKAIHAFKHNLLDRNCFETQRAIKKFHQTNTRLYFTGGWSNGAGLHEECWLQAEKIASYALHHMERWLVQGSWRGIQQPSQRQQRSVQA